MLHDDWLCCKDAGNVAQVRHVEASPPALNPPGPIAIETVAGAVAEQAQGRLHGSVQEAECRCFNLLLTQARAVGAILDTTWQQTRGPGSSGAHGLAARG